MKLTLRQRRIIADRYYQLICEGSDKAGEVGALINGYGISKNRLTTILYQFYTHEEIAALRRRNSLLHQTHPVYQCSGNGHWRLNRF
jgi:hypothetical protein